MISKIGSEDDVAEEFNTKTHALLGYGMEVEKAQSRHFNSSIKLQA